MYLRFVLARIDPATGVEAGFFRGAYALARDGSGAPEWLRAELRCELDWFDLHLAVPKQIRERRRRRQTVRGLCWFRPEASEAIARARHCVWLMGEAGLPVATIRSREPGQIVWSDAAQVLARAGHHVPRAFA